jgi:uncharacterized protein (TIGR03435 family)
MGPESMELGILRLRFLQCLPDWLILSARAAGVDRVAPLSPAMQDRQALRCPSHRTRLVSLFDAIDKQLGLKLEMRKNPMPVLVIDHIEPKPTEN